MLIRKTLVACIMMALSLGAQAASLSLNPGLWETTMTRTNPMTGAPTTETSTECVSDETFDPREMMKDAEGCRLTDENLSGDTLTFTMSCEVQGGAGATIQGRFQSDGDSGTGDMNMSMNMGGMSMEMDMNWTARRLGEC